MTRPHIEGLILALIHDMREQAAVATPFTEKLLSRYVNELVGIRAALAALPGGGVDASMLWWLQDAANSICGQQGATTHQAKLLELHKQLTAPTPNPHEADRNG